MNVRLCYDDDSGEKQEREEKKMMNLYKKYNLNFFVYKSEIFFSYVLFWRSSRKTVSNSMKNNFEYLHSNSLVSNQLIDMIFL